AVRHRPAGSTGARSWGRREAGEHHAESEWPSSPLFVGRSESSVATLAVPPHVDIFLALRRGRPAARGRPRCSLLSECPWQAVVLRPVHQADESAVAWAGEVADVTRARVTRRPSAKRTVTVRHAAGFASACFCQLNFVRGRSWRTPST